MTRDGPRRTTRRPSILGAGLAFVALFLAASGAFGHAMPSTDPSYASVDTGGVHIDVPSALPRIDLTQDANNSVGATLGMDRIVEVNDSTGDPQVVARATVTDARSFNASGATGPNLLAGLSANLTVFASSGDLFPPAGLQGHFAPATPIAPTTIIVTVDTTGTAGTVSVSAAIEGWPWVATTDVLAVGWSFQVGHAAGFSGCTRAVPAAVPSSDCGSDPFAVGNSTWNDNLDGIQGIASNGPQAQLGWSASVGTSSGNVPVISGAQRTATAPGTAEVVLGAAAQGASSVEYGLSYALLVPPVLSHLVHGSLLPYVGGAVAAAVLAAGAVVYVRRRDQKVLDAL